MKFFIYKTLSFLAKLVTLLRKVPALLAKRTSSTEVFLVTMKRFNILAKELPSTLIYISSFKYLPYKFRNLKKLSLGNYYFSFPDNLILLAISRHITCTFFNCQIFQAGQLKSYKINFKVKQLNLYFGS